MATAFYYLAAAPPASAAVDVCGPGNFSSECAPSEVPSPAPAATSSPASQRNPVQEAPVESPQPIESGLVQDAPQPVESPVPLLVDPAVESSPAPTQDPIPLVPVTEPETTPALNFTNIYTAPTPVRTTAIPEPGTVVALLLTGAGIICSARKRNKQVGQQR
ncbi:MAG: PEP-CTERM sorting domain-containing protein [Cyanobacteria bacterium 0813]|nr:PEP-CTERM sorting domain-containing protein [Cyanobacteria bacterium 0813]